jgi:23S rRNA pseudouridine955/2504/2580 synthase
MANYIDVKVQPEYQGRLDKYLKSLYPLLTQGRIQKAVRTGMIRLNSKRCLAKAKVQGQDIIKVPLHFKDYVRVPGNNYSPDVISLADKVLNKYKLYEDENLFVINKPSNLASQKGSKILISLDCALKYINENHGFSLRLVHRLDKETSGVMLISKTLASAILITQAFQERKVQKEYISLNYINGDLPDLKPATHSFSNALGKESITKYSIIEKLDSKVAKILWQPVTGRKHQIRQQAQLIGCPIIGDKKYSLDEFPKCNVKNFFLHSAKISLPKGLLKGTDVLEFNAELPCYFKEFTLLEKKEITL